MRNRFEGYCLKCGKKVPAGQGHPERKNGYWAIRCLDCVNPDKKPHSTATTSQNTTRIK